MSETPTISGSSYTTAAYSVVGDATGGYGSGLAGTIGHHGTSGWSGLSLNQLTQSSKENEVATRVVQVYIADPNENIPVEKRLIYKGDEKLTEATDQELFFEIPINELLNTHNALRKTTVDKKQAERFGRDVFLEPIRIRDLKMVVVSVAAF